MHKKRNREKLSRFEITGSDGKMRMTNVADTE